MAVGVIPPAPSPVRLLSLRGGPAAPTPSPARRVVGTGPSHRPLLQRRRPAPGGVRRPRRAAARQPRAPPRRAGLGRPPARPADPADRPARHRPAADPCSARDGARLYTASPVAVYNVRTGRPLVSHGPDSWSGAALSHSGSELALTGNQIDGTNSILLVDGRTLQVRRRLSGMLPGCSSGMTFSADDRQVAAFDGGGNVYVWDTATGQLTHTLRTNDTFTKGLAFSPNGARLYTAGGARQLEEWDLTGTHSLLDRVHVRHPDPGFRSDLSRRVADRLFRPVREPDHVRRRRPRDSPARPGTSRSATPTSPSRGRPTVGTTPSPSTADASISSTP